MKDYKYYLFIDTEVCLSREYYHPICAFGYVLTDTEFNLIEAKDILINPEEKFEIKHAVNRGFLKLDYDLNSFNKYKNFKTKSPELYKLLNQKDTLVFGFSMVNDNMNILSSFKRYKLDQPSFDYLDIQMLYLHISDSPKNQPPSVSSLCKKFNLEESQDSHSALKDSLLTMKVFKKLVDTLNYKSCIDFIRDFNYLIEEYPNYIKLQENYEEVLADAFVDYFINNKQQVIDECLMTISSNFNRKNKKEAIGSHVKYYSFEDRTVLNSSLDKVIRLVAALSRNSYIYKVGANVPKLSLKELVKLSNYESFSKITPYPLNNYHPYLIDERLSKKDTALFNLYKFINNFERHAGIHAKIKKYKTKVRNQYKIESPSAYYLSKATDKRKKLI